MSLFICPVCGAPLTREEKRYVCPSRHSFDIAAAGYTHLLLANRMHSKTPGDDKGMAAARNRFLSGGYYLPLRTALEELALSLTGDAPRVLDSGCGEGFYTAGIEQALRAAGKAPAVAGIDISKFSLRWAAKRAPQVEFAVASAYHLPVADSSIDLLVNCFSPLGLEEFRRVLAPGGALLYVVPGPRHLWQLKEVLYDRPYPNEEKETPYEGFSYQQIRRVRGQITLDSPQAIRDIFQMTPYYWKTPKAGAERLAQLDRLETEIAFDIHVFRRDSGDTRAQQRTT
ncbi:MAG: methyltransferase domain-containing protein [Oscillospiraceae bacterium]|nr:methyltransferase domain-containing protein [Oscillospiraceae bacterium]